MQRSAKHFIVIKAARKIKKEIEKVGMDELKILAETGISIVGTYLNGCSPQEKATYKRDLNALLQMGLTADMILDEVSRQMPVLSPIMDGKGTYKKGEIEQLKKFLAEEQ